VLGADEVASGTATLRDMQTHEQVRLPLAELVATVSQRIS
jgi:histidine--tRNA ligase